MLNVHEDIRKILIFIIIKQANCYLSARNIRNTRSKFAFPFVGKPRLELTRGFSLIFARISRIIRSHRKPGLAD